MRYQVCCDREASERLGDLVGLACLVSNAPAQGGRGAQNMTRSRLEHCSID